MKQFWRTVQLQQILFGLCVLHESLLSESCIKQQKIKLVIFETDKFDRIMSKSQAKRNKQLAENKELQAKSNERQRKTN